ncbi:MAG: Rep family protein [Eubacteriales bacterium]|nr:Rep family protein [Eubacteriales bacterium]
MTSYKRLYEVQTQTDYLPKEKLLEVLASHSKDIEQYAYILHDKDIQKDGTAKKPHWHIELKLYKSRRRADVAAWFGLSESYIQDSKSGKYENMLLYLIHENAPEKHQYSQEEVSSNFNYAERLETIRNNKIKLDKDARKNELMEMAASGTLRRYNWSQFLTVREWDMYKRSIQNAWEYRDNQIRTSKRQMEVIYICGTGRCGKSTLAHKIAESKGFSYENSGSSRDPMQPYNGQDAYILDDIRGNSFIFDDLMGVLDNFVNREVPARYRDKSLSECKMMIVTTTQSIEDFFKELAEDRPEEPPQQLYGRCGTLIEMDRKYIKISEWNSETEKYSEPLITENHVLDDIPIEKPRSEPERKERAAALLGVDQNLFSRKIEVEKPEGVLPIKREPTTATIKFLDDTGSNRVYIVADSVNLKTKAKMEHFASELLSYI